MPYYGVWFAGRNTPVVASAKSRSAAIRIARKKKKRGGSKVVSARKLKGSAAKQARKGRWVRQRRDGKSPGKSRYGKGRGYGPPRRKKR